MPKIYTQKYLNMAKREYLIKTVLAWQEEAEMPVNSPQAKEPDPTLPDRVYEIINSWAGRLIGRKINNIVPGPPEPLEQVVAKVIAEVEL